MLTVKQIEAAQFGTSPLRMHDGHGLYVRLNKGGAKTFQLRIREGTSTRWITLGGFPEMSLRDARLKSALKKVELLDPESEKPSSAENIQFSNIPERNVRPPLFREFSQTWFERKKEGLSNGKHIAQNWSTLETYVFPHIGRMRLDEIKQRHIIAVFDPVWRLKHETARRTLGRVKEVFELAKLLEFVEVNPADFNTQIAFGRVARDHAHQPSLDWGRAPQLWQWLQTCHVREDLRQMVMTMILSGKRTKEVRFVEWSDIDIDDCIWTSQREHMKMRRTHRVPISKQLGIVFGNMQLLTSDQQQVFSRPRNKLGVIDENSARMVFQRFDATITGHGIRTTFRTWARKQNKYAQDVMETALSHEKDTLVAAYMRDDLLEERRIMMQDWADYVTCGELPSRLTDVI